MSQRGKVSKDGNREKHRAAQGTPQDAEEAEMDTKNSDVVRSKTFNFHSVRSIIIAWPKTKGSPKSSIYEYKTVTDGNLMPIRMYRTLFHSQMSLS